MLFAVVLTLHPTAALSPCHHAGPGPYCPKPRAFYEALESAIKPKLPNIVTAEDGDYWKAVRQGAAPCFSVSNMKKVCLR